MGCLSSPVPGEEEILFNEPIAEQSEINSGLIRLHMCLEPVTHISEFFITCTGKVISPQLAHHTLGK